MDGVLGALDQPRFLNHIRALESHLYRPLLQINYNNLVLEINQQQLLLSKNGTVFDQFLTIINFTRTNKVLLFLLDDGLLGPSHTRPESDGWLILSICDEVVVVV